MADQYRGIFEFKDYKSYISHRITSMPNGGRGARSTIAKLARCQTVYISRILNGDAHLSLEQADAIQNFLEHTKDEAQYFIFLLQYNKSGTSSLKNFFYEQMEEIKKKRLNLKNRFQLKELDIEQQSIYYSAWYFSAIHVALSLPNVNTISDLSSYLKLNKSIVKEVLDFLLSQGLAKQTNGNFTIGDSIIHLGLDSPLISKHHSNWRMKAIQNLEASKKENLHYSSVVTLSKDDSYKIKDLLVREIEKIKTTIHNSKEEKLFGFSMDFFDLN